MFVGKAPKCALYVIEGTLTSCARRSFSDENDELDSHLSVNSSSRPIHHGTFLMCPKDHPYESVILSYTGISTWWSSPPTRAFGAIAADSRSMGQVWDLTLIVFVKETKHLKGSSQINKKEGKCRQELLKQKEKEKVTNVF
ncbi:hypothetical protein BLOT_003819 [Blomia tropicalis]|nr:hypothetical protein BLOT_003819 [Blomia tropicalis]